MATVRPQRFGELLKRYRLAAGLTQEELAERAGLSVQAIAALERGARRSPRRDTLALLAQALALAPAERSQLEAARRHTAPPASVRSLPGRALSSPPLVGRAQELALLDRHLSAEAEGP